MAGNQHPDVDGIEKVGEQLYRVLCHSYTGEVKTLLLELVMAMKPIGSSPQWKALAEVAIAFGERLYFRNMGRNTCPERSSEALGSDEC